MAPGAQHLTRMAAPESFTQPLAVKTTFVARRWLPRAYVAPTSEAASRQHANPHSGSRASGRPPNPTATEPATRR